MSVSGFVCLLVWLSDLLVCYVAHDVLLGQAASMVKLSRVVAAELFAPSFHLTHVGSAHRWSSVRCLLRSLGLNILLRLARRHCKVNVFCPDGAPDEQLGGRLASDVFGNLSFVIRCAAHGIHGAVKNAWRSDDEVARITKVVVQEVAKFLRTSDRFRRRFQGRAQEDMMAAVTNFDFAPQRFASKDRPLSRFVLYAESIMVVLAMEVDCPSSPKRAKWASDLLRELSPATWVLIGVPGVKM